MIRSLFAAMLAGVLVHAFVAMPVRAAPLDHPAVDRYVTGWQERDGAKVVSAFATDGRYRDPSLARPLDVAGIAAHVAAHRDARFELLASRQTAADAVELRWRVRWPAQPDGLEFVDAVQLKGQAIAWVESVSAAPPDAARLVADYEVMHDTPTPERLQKLVRQDVEVYGSTLPPAGLRYDTFLPFLEQLHGTAFRQVPGVPLAQTKDGRIVMHWTLTGGGKQVAAGVDYITVEDGRIRKIVGVY